ncbi:MAG: SDR family NAD(P)-dependent oxidoreductase, partial [Desulfobacterales bacterium]|nr:SDR family NAD(P)-dependent oxidoreductase [Desulfobacterales bacterium]
MCRALDLPAALDRIKENIENTVALMMTRGAVEMGLNGEQCVIPSLKPAQAGREKIRLDKKDVVVITGGAKGVTAECALQLARACSPRIVLLGRSPAPFREPEWLEGITDPGEMKKAILSREYADKKATPAKIQQRYQAILSNRSIQENINRISEHSPQTRYISVDIRDTAQVKGIFDQIRKDIGPVSAVIHGAGVLEDKLIAEKKADQFKRVFETKVKGLEAILEAVKDTPLKYMVLFSSVAARFGNQGQCDYAMANEVLNKVAQSQARINPECRYISINWGPWAGGMVNDGLKKEFSKRGIELIPLAAGAEQLLVEMGNPDKNCIEVVIGAALTSPDPNSKSPSKKVLSQIMGSKASPIITHHKINHEPVVPLAMMVDLFACAAEQNNPDLKFVGLDEMRLLKGITPGDTDLPVQINLTKSTPDGGMQSAHVTLTSRDKKGIETVHANGITLVRPSIPEPPALSETAFMDLHPYGMSVEEAYEKVLFHGKGLQCIKSVNGVSPKGIDVVACPAPDTGLWYTSPHSKDWTIDPMILDAAFQAVILWTYETRQQVCLPSYFSNLRIYSSYGELTGNIRILFTVNHETRHKVQGYFTFLDETETPIASVMGFEAIVDPGLLDKFKAKPLFDRDKILAFAQGNPSEAFGSPYKVFDKDREIARLPRPPYFFMDRVVTADHTPWEMQSGGWIETEYEIPEDEWYFKANRTQTMPFCILLEIALQPCGWLAAYAGSALKSDERLHFRNLGGNAELIRNVSLDSGVLTIRARMTDVSHAGGMIIQDFEMEVLNHGQMIYKGTTNFGFFTGKALSNQVGIRNSKLSIDLENLPESDRINFKNDAPVSPDDNNQSLNSGMPSKALRMIDAIDHFSFDGGLHGKGFIKAS